MIHATAVVDDGAVIGPDTQIWHFCHVSSGARVGARCVLGQNVYIGPNVRIGDGTRIQNNVSIYEGVELEEDVFCGPSCVFTNVNNPRAFVSRRQEFAPTRVRRGATLGANATIVCGSTIGQYAFIGAGAVVARSDVPDHALMLGVPARQVGWVSRRGQRLSQPDGDGVYRCPESGARYREVGGRLTCLDRDD